MRYSPAEKLEIIRLVDGSDIGVTRTLKELGIHKSTFYNWYERYQQHGPDGLKDKAPSMKRIWNRIPEAERERVVEIALDKEELSARELAWHITDHHDYYISESSVYRILREYGLLTAPAHIVLSASDEFKDKTSRPNEMWQIEERDSRIPLKINCGMSKQISPTSKSSDGAGITSLLFSMITLVTLSGGNFAKA